MVGSRDAASTARFEMNDRRPPGAVRKCPRGDLAIYDTSRDLALGALNVPHVGRQPQTTIIMGQFPPRLTTIKLAGPAKGFPTRGGRIPTYSP